MAKGKSTKGLLDKRRTLEWKLKRRSAMNIANGLPAGWASKALDAYLGGMSDADIARVFSVSSVACSNAIAREALYRLMAQRQAERLEEMGLSADGASTP